MKNTGLEISIAEDELIIRVGISTLCNAIRLCPYIDNFVMDHDGDESSVVINNELLFAKAIVAALEEEEEDGSTLVHRMLDTAAEAAIDDGCEGIDFYD